MSWLAEKTEEEREQVRAMIVESILASYHAYVAKHPEPLPPYDPEQEPPRVFARMVESQYWRKKVMEGR